MRTRGDVTGRWLAVILLIGLLVRLPFAHLDPRVAADLELMRGWARIIATQGLVAVSSASEVTHHQPLAMYLIGLAGWIEAHLPDALRHGDAALNALIKLPSILADVATAGVLAWSLRSHGARTQLRAAALHAFNPGVWYVSTMWGQNDAIYTLLLLVAFSTLSASAVRTAWVSYGLALATKLQSVFQAPVLLLASVRRGDMRAAVTGVAIAGACYLLLAAPWWATGHAFEFTRASVHRPMQLNASAYNLWYLVFLGRVGGVSAHASPLGLPLSYAWLGSLLFVAFVALVLALMWRQKSHGDAALPAVLLALAPFVLLPDMHERYLLPALPLLLWCVSSSHDATVRRQLWWCYGLLTVTFFYNVVTVGSFAPQLWGNLIALSPPYARHIVLLKAIAVAAAAINVAVLVWLTRLLALVEELTVIEGRLLR